MVLIPAEEYKELLEEAGYIKTPKLDKEIAAARARFRKGKTIPWEALKRDLR
jgi:PHD/YefM family antitoxin component YafN of YafNO toxin-antitoxin module